MGKYLDQLHNKGGMPTEYRNRVDLDTALKERGMDGFYGRGKKAEEQKELHTFITKRTREVGENQAQRELDSGRMFNRKDIKKV